MRKGNWIAICLSLLFIGLFAVGFYTLNDVQIESTFKIDEQNIMEKNGDHYLLINERELALPKDFYDKIELEKYNKYKIKYVYNRIKKNDGEVVMLKRYGEQPWGQ